jgi:hypothetical protein
MLSVKNFSDTMKRPTLTKKTGLPVSELIRRAIDEYLEQLQRKADHLGAVIDQEAPHG